jgi:hypothetical protein
MTKRHRNSEKPYAPDPAAIIGSILSLGVIRSISRSRSEANKTSGKTVKRPADGRPSANVR